MSTVGILLTISSIVFSFVLVPAVVLFQLIGSKKSKEHKEIISSLINFQDEKELLSNYNLLFEELEKTKLNKEKINDLTNAIKSKLLCSKPKGIIKNSFIFNKKVLVTQLGEISKIKSYSDIKLTKKLTFGELKKLRVLSDDKIFNLKNTENVRIALLSILVLYVSEPSFISYLKHNPKYNYIFDEFKNLADTKNSLKLFKAKHKILKSLKNSLKDEKTAEKKLKLSKGESLNYSKSTKSTKSSSLKNAKEKPVKEKVKKENLKPSKQKKEKKPKKEVTKIKKSKKKRRRGEKNV